MGSYEPLIDLASGGMGTVAIARRVGAAGFERLVVTKRVHPRLLADASYRRMIRDEALLLARVHDAHVVPILDVVDADGELILVLEYVESLSLAELLASAKSRGTRIPLPVVARIVVDALAGLHAAHECTDPHGAPLGIIHRDVSPQNVIVGTDGVSRLVDFGIAKATTPTADPEVTTGDVIKGKVRYLSPEQIKQASLDRRSDVFSAGVVLYEAATAERLVAAADEGDVLLGTLLGDFAPPSKHDASIAEGLDVVVLRALAVDRDERFATAADLAEAIEHALPVTSAREVAQIVERFGGDVLADRRARLRSVGRTSAQPPPSKRPRAWLLAALVALPVVAIALFALRPKAVPAAPPAVTCSRDGYPFRSSIYRNTDTVSERGEGCQRRSGSSERDEASRFAARNHAGAEPMRSALRRAPRRHAPLQATMCTMRPDAPASSALVDARHPRHERRRARDRAREAVVHRSESSGSAPRA